MKIVHVINYFQPKLGYQETFLAREHIRKGHDVAVVTSDRYYPFVDYEKSYGDLLGRRICRIGKQVEEDIPVVRLPVSFEIKYRVWLKGLEKTILELKPDLIIVHALLANAFRLMRLRKKGTNFKLVIDEHLINLVRDRSALANLYNTFKRTRLRGQIQFVDKFVGVTQETCQILNEDFAIPKEKIAYIPLGADTELFRFDALQRQKIRKKYQLKEDDILLLYTGKIDPSKGLETLLEAFNHLNGKTDIHLLMVGKSDQKYQHRLLENMDASKRHKITFTNFVPNNELPQYYSASDVCVWGDTISGSMLEAMSCSRPIVGCDIPAVLERLEYGNGLSYKKGDSLDLSQKLNKLIKNSNLRLDMGKKGRKFVEDKFSWQGISDQFLVI
jgi:glycosyltransferase involved in cell wall biosynthesis